jgi:very-short-patch-repair endonuclease
LSKIPKALSPGECAFELHCRAEGLRPEREFRFMDDRKFRLDFAFPEQKVAVEVEGGTWIAGRHSRGSTMAKDMAKYNRGTILGWRILRYSTEMVTAGTAIDEVLEILGLVPGGQ